ncbi:MAG: DUF3015 family protein [SAR324 cluster bacterium]|nr:DUF3015 family protein [SAR324 cluster bacterium]MBF0352583.1 DUF3015 family protein [SAR324 cluster bacterium]
MFKKLVFVAMAASIIPVSSLFADTGAGCGLSTVVPWVNENKTVLQKLLAGTTNGISGNQSFAITTGTLGCTNEGFVKNEEKARMFVASNFDSLKTDIAQGQGEFLSTLAQIIEVPASQQQEFYSFTQSHYTQLFQSAQTSPQEMISQLSSQLRTHQSLNSIVM